MRAFRHRAAACCVVLAAALISAGCGSGKHPYDATAENNGYYVHLDGVSYQLQVSRELNQYSQEDSQYLAGLPSSQTSLSPSQLWYGVFLRAVNDSHHTHTTSGPSSITITDTQPGHIYYPTPLAAGNQYAWTPMSLNPNDTEPTPDSTAYFGPTQGGLVLFKLPTSVYANRPLTLRIQGTGGSRDVATISLDL